MDENAKDWTQNIGLLKRVVAVLTVLLIIGFGLFIYGIARTLSTAAPDRAVAGADDVATLSALATIELQEGDRIIDYKVADTRMVLQVRQSDGNAAFIVVDLRGRKPSLRLSVAPAP